MTHAQPTRAPPDTPMPSRVGEGIDGAPEQAVLLVYML